MMSTMANAAAGVAALVGALAWRRTSESEPRLAQQETDVESVVQPETMSRHKGDCGR
ncbi:hypothetical protein SAMN05192563_10082 [Paraburkholderia aspalathi]|uniref:Uncharacterized protein n=1 Tax=Paraburkholderia aspalathi TaxID=1324617 RepID=A0A1I7CXJ5_9BURK|nr:hypothetical protein SAMN05192563_10082 [Paraburkholderia aspalathi]